MRLTPTGRARATGLAWGFCVVATFFESVLGVDLDDRTSYEISSTLPSDRIFRLWELTDKPCIVECPAATGDHAECSV